MLRESTHQLLTFGITQPPTEDEPGAAGIHGGGQADLPRFLKVQIVGGF